jgi:hypothetical protein
MSWKFEVVMDDSGEWESDSLRFATQQEALAYARDLEFRCSAIRDKRIVRCENPDWFEGDSQSPAKHHDNPGGHRKRLLS